MGLRTLLFALAIYVVFRMLKNRFKRARTKPPAVTYSDTVTCSQCGVRFPNQESNDSDKLHFCSQAHRKQYFDQHGA